MSDETPQFPEHFHPPFSDELPKDDALKKSHSSIEIKQTIGDEIARLEETSRNHPLENIPKYPALYTLSLFANLAYEKSEEIQSALVKVEGWQLLTTAESANGYFGAVFWHPANHQIVIAHRGTDPSRIWNNVIKADIRGVYLNNYVDRMSSAATFAEKILTIFEKVEKELNYSIQLFFTGHSLGGWLAQVTTFTTEYLRPMKNADRYLFRNPSCSKKLATWPHHAHTVVFESPGCAGMLRKMRQNFNLHSSYYSTDLNTLDITNYLSAPNIINTCNEHLGTCYRLITDLSEVGNKSGWSEWIVDQITADYTLATHSKDKIQAFLLGLEGKPIAEVKAKVKEILDWPTLDLPERKDYKKLFEEDLFFWANNYYLDPTGNKYVDENGLYIVRYQTRDFDELSSCLSMFTTYERKFLERYVWMRESKLPVFQPTEWFSPLHNEELKSKAITLLGDFCIEKEKFRCSNIKIMNEFAPFVRTLLKLYPSIDKRAQESITTKSIAKKIFQFEAQNYRKSFERNSNAFDVNVESFGILDFLAGEKRICHILAPESKDENLGIRLVYSVVKKILRQKTIITDDSQCTILKLKRFLNLMQQGIDVQHIFLDAKHLLILDCKKLELDDVDKRFLSELFLVAKNITNMKLILLSNSVLQDKTVGDLIGKQQLDMFYAKTALQSLNWADLTPDYQLKLLEKPVRLAGSSEEMHLNGLLRDYPPLELSAEAILELINARDVIIIGKEPQRLSDLEAAYAKCFLTIEASDLRRAMVRVDNVHTIFIIDGLLSLQVLIEKLKVVDDGEVTHLESQMHENIRLVTGEYSEQEFKQFCHDHPTSQIQWISYKSLSGEWFWKQLYDPRFYVERELNQIAHPETIESILKDKNSTESFVVTGLDYDELLQLIGLNINDEEEKKRVSSRLSAVKKVEDLENDKLNHIDFVHRLKYEVPNGSNVKQLVREVNASSSMTKGEFHSLRGETLSVIVDHPGMGKSTTLTRLTEERLSRNWVMRVNLKHCSSHLCQLSDKPNVDEVIDFLWKATDGEVEAYLAKSVLKYILEKPKADVGRPILLLFDGFDEIDQESQDKIISLLGLLQGIFEKSRHQIVITTRRHPELEKKLQMLYTVEFAPLDREHQIGFLKSHWLRRSEFLISNLITAPAKSEQYAKGLLHQADTSLGEKMALFIGIPMHLRLLTEGFRDDFLKFVKSSVHPPAFKSIGLLEGNCEIVEFLLQALDAETLKAILSSAPDIGDIRQSKPPLHIAAASGRSDIVGLLLARMEENEESKVKNFAINAKDKYGETPLHSAIKNGRVEVVQILLKANHVDVNAISYNRRTTLHIAASRSNSDIVGILLARIEENEESKVKTFAINAKDKYGETPLHLAIKNGCVGVVQILLKAKHVDVNAISHNKRTALHIAASRSNSDIVGILLARIEENEESESENFAVNAKDENGETPLHLAIKNGSVGVVQILLEAKNVDVNAISHDERTALHIAASRSNSDIVGILLARIDENEESKVESFAVNAKDKYGETPLHLAIKNGNVEVLQILLKAKHVDVNAISHDERTVLHIAACGGNSDFVRILLARIEENEESKVENFAVNAKDENGETPLHLAIKNGSVEVVQLLLKAKHVDVNAISHNERTALHIAARRGHSYIVRLLLARIEENDESKVENFAVNAKDGNGETPLHLAIKNGRVEVVQLLLKAKHVDVNAISQNERTALHIAARRGKSDIVRILLARIEENEESKVGNFAVNAKNEGGETPLHIAIRKDLVKIVKILLRAINIDCEIKGGKDDETALHYAVRSPHENKTEIIQYLLSSEVIDVNSRNENNMTPLHLASKSNQVKIVKTLLAARNIDVNAKGGYDNMTSLQMASNEGHEDVEKLLVKYHG